MIASRQKTTSKKCFELDFMSVCLSVYMAVIIDNAEETNLSV